MALPLQQTKDLSLSLLQTSWKAQLDPVLNNATTNPTILKNIVLQIGNNVISHGLQQMMQGWKLSDINGASTIYRSAPLNSKTLTLNSTAVVTVNIEVY